MKIKQTILLLLLNGVPNVYAQTFYVDPILGSMKNSGTSSQPWRTFEEVVNNGLISTKDISGAIVNPLGKVKAGDTILLMRGYHGDINLKKAYNDQNIIVAAKAGHTPKIGSLTLVNGKNWIFDGLVIDYSRSATVGTDNIVTIGMTESTSAVTLKNSYIYSQDAVKDWTTTKNGIVLGQSATDITLTNNYIKNIKIGINANAANSKINGNVIAVYAKDGIRIGNDGINVTYNVITDNVLDDGNHDDAIQGYVSGTVGPKNTSLIGNVILEKNDPTNTFTAAAQGIGFFDGPIISIAVKNNVIKIGGYHAISLYDSTSSTIVNNYTIGFQGAGSRVTLGTAGKGGANGNEVSGNTAQLFSLDLDKNLKTTGNSTVPLDATSEAAFNLKLAERMAEINTKFTIPYAWSGNTRLK